MFNLFGIVLFYYLNGQVSGKGNVNRGNFCVGNDAVP